MKKFLIAVLFLSHCSFDNKTGIWKNSNEVDLIKKTDLKILKRFMLNKNHSMI